MNTTTGKIAWSNKLPQKMYSGIVVAGDLVFFGEGNGNFNAVDAQTGTVLWTFKSNLPNVGGANGAPAVYVVNGVEYVVMAFGGSADAGFTKGDALIAFALPPSGQMQPMMVQANPVQVATGDLPASATQPPLATAPPDARVVELVAHDFAFEPRSFTALARRKNRGPNREYRSRGNRFHDHAAHGTHRVKWDDRGESKRLLRFHRSQPAGRI